MGRMGEVETRWGRAEQIKPRLLSTWAQAVLGWVCVCVCENVCLVGGSLCP